LFSIAACYSREIGKELTAGVQYYVEQMPDYGRYKDNLAGWPAMDRDRLLITVRMTKLLMNQNLSNVPFYILQPDGQGYSYSAKRAL